MASMSVDADGNRLIDYYCGMGAMVLGHSPKSVQQAVKDQVEKGKLVSVKNTGPDGKPVDLKQFSFSIKSTCP